MTPTQFLNTLGNEVNIMDVTQDSIETSSKIQDVKTNSRHILKEVMDKGIWKDVKIIILGNKGKAAMEELKKQFNLVLSRKTIWAWRKIALEELAEEADANTRIQIVENRNETRKLLLNNDATVDLIQKKFKLLALQKRRLDIDTRLERQMKKTIPTVDKIVEVYLEILDSLMRDLQTLGIMPTQFNPENREINEMDALVAVLRKRIRIVKVEESPE